MCPIFLTANNRSTNALRQLCSAYRSFQDTLPDDMLSAAFTGVINDVGIDPTLIGDICIGKILQAY